MSPLAAIARWLKRPSEPPASVQERSVASVLRDATGRTVSAVSAESGPVRDSRDPGGTLLSSGADGKAGTAQ